MRIVCFLWLLTVSVFSLLPAAALAQNAAEMSGERAAGLLENFSAINDAAERSSLLLQTDDGAGVTFADVLRNPDDIPLNFRWAKAQVARGDVRGAVATLERILAIDPALVPVRLYYAIVLYRLDSLDEAKAQFEQLQSMGLDGAVGRQVEAFLNEIQKRRQTVHQSLTLTFGTHIDTNRNFSPRGEERLVAGRRMGMTNTDDLQKRDIGWLGLMRYEIDYDLGHQEGHALFGSVTGFTDDQVNLDSLDIMSLGLEGGMHWRYSNKITLSPSLLHTTQSLSREKFLTSRGARLRVDYALAPDVALWARAGYFDERYHAVTESAALSLRSGQRTDMQLGAQYTWTPQHRTALVLDGARKEAEVNYYSYRSYNAEATHTYLMDAGRYLQGAVSYGLSGYFEHDQALTPATAPLRRQDKPLKLRATFGAPISELLPRDWLVERGMQELFYDTVLAGITWSVSGEVLFQESSLPNYAYTNKRAQFLLNRRWEW